MRRAWDKLGLTGKVSVIAGVCVIVGVFLPWMSWPGGSETLLSGNEMEMLFKSPELQEDTTETTVGSAQTLYIALATGIVAGAVPLIRKWDGKSAFFTLSISGFAYLLLTIQMMFLYDGTDRGALVAGERVASSASAGIGAYIIWTATTIVGLASLVHVGSALLARIRN
jgi:hypothetical protein